MLENFKTKLREHQSPEKKYSVLREELQLIVLSIISSRGYFKNISFLGGTALRILYQIQRYSEDLDFSLYKKDSYDFEEMMTTIVRELNLRNLNVDVKLKRSVGTVRSCFLRFTNLLFELGLSPLKDQKISIKFEVDENPPMGFNTELTLIPRNQNFTISNFDKPTLYAGKLNAILCRQYTKGRDFFDLLWFLAEHSEINIEFLNNGMEQQLNGNFNLDKTAIKKSLLEKIQASDFIKIREDLRPFIFDEKSLEFYTKENFSSQVDRFF